MSKLPWLSCISVCLLVVFLFLAEACMRQPEPTCDCSGLKWQIGDLERRIRSEEQQRIGENEKCAEEKGFIRAQVTDGNNQLMKTREKLLQTENELKQTWEKLQLSESTLKKKEEENKKLQKQLKSCETELPPAVEAIRSLRQLDKQRKGDLDKHSTDLSDKEKAYQGLVDRHHERDKSCARTEEKLTAINESNEKCQEERKALQIRVDELGDEKFFAFCAAVFFIVAKYCVERFYWERENRRIVAQQMQHEQQLPMLQNGGMNQAGPDAPVADPVHHPANGAQRDGGEIQPAGPVGGQRGPFNEPDGGVRQPPRPAEGHQLQRDVGDMQPHPARSHQEQRASGGLQRQGPKEGHQQQRDVRNRQTHGQQPPLGERDDEDEPRGVEDRDGVRRTQSPRQGLLGGQPRVENVAPPRGNIQEYLGPEGGVVRGERLEARRAQSLDQNLRRRNENSERHGHRHWSYEGQRYDNDFDQHNGSVPQPQPRQGGRRYSNDEIKFNEADEPGAYHPRRDVGDMQQGAGSSRGTINPPPYNSLPLQQQRSDIARYQNPGEMPRGSSSRNQQQRRNDGELRHTAATFDDGKGQPNMSDSDGPDADVQRHRGRWADNRARSYREPEETNSRGDRNNAAGTSSSRGRPADNAQDIGQQRRSSGKRKKKKRKSSGQIGLPNPNQENVAENEGEEGIGQAQTVLNDDHFNGDARQMPERASRGHVRDENVNDAIREERPRSDRPGQIRREGPERDDSSRHGPGESGGPERVRSLSMRNVPGEPGGSGVAHATDSDEQDVRNPSRGHPVRENSSQPSEDEAGLINLTVLEDEPEPVQVSPHSYCMTDLHDVPTGVPESSHALQ